ncbi:MAG TPA: sialidase family protein [Actinomycetota bacterium]
MIRSATRAAVLVGALVFSIGLVGQALAAVPLTTVSTDPYTNSSSYHATQVEPDTFASGSTIVSTFQSGRFEDGGASNLGWATSTDGGSSWTHGFLPQTTVFATPAGPWARISDPSVAFDPKHGVWMISGLAINSAAVGKAVIVNRSRDGLTWQRPVTVSKGGGADFYDKDWIACDGTPSSPFYGNCYVEWDNANAGNVLMMARSTDGGRHWTMSNTPSAAVIGGQPVAQPNGNVVVPIDDAFEGSVEAFVSTNGGASYTGPNTVSSLQTHFVAGNLRTDALPSAAVDASGTVYVAWQDCRFRSSCSANDIVFSTSTDGVHWSAVKRVPFAATSSPMDFFIPGIDVQPGTSGSTAHVGVASYAYTNKSCNTSTCQLEVVFSSSTNGGATWSSTTTVLGPLKLTWLPLTNQGYMVGDYISTSFAGSNAFPVVANATAASCSQNVVGSCNEFMVAPTSGLAATGGSRPAGTRPVAGARSDHPQGGAKTAF